MESVGGLFVFVLFNKLTPHCDTVFTVVNKAGSVRRSEHVITRRVTNEKTQINGNMMT